MVFAHVVRRGREDVALYQLADSFSSTVICESNCATCASMAGSRATAAFAHGPDLGMNLGLTLQNLQWRAVFAGADRNFSRSRRAGGVEYRCEPVDLGQRRTGAERQRDGERKRGISQSANPGCLRT